MIDIIEIYGKIDSVSTVNKKTCTRQGGPYEFF